MKTRCSWPLALLLTTCALVAPVGSYLQSQGILPVATPFVVLLLWAPFLLWEGLHRWRTIEQEKQALQAKFDAQDAELFANRS